MQNPDTSNRERCFSSRLRNVGDPTKTAELNSLAQASSSYLRSAMHQPIRWHEWGDEAFATAQRENKPILLDIGAVWCHWCHVMDRESYDEPEVAQIVNEKYVAIKVDRDERPDIDSRYQSAVQAMTGQGGWPLTAFLTPEGKPFFGGTYFPPQDHYGRPGFKRVLLTIAEAFSEKKTEVDEQADTVMNMIGRTEAFADVDAERVIVRRPSITSSAARRACSTPSTAVSAARRNSRIPRRSICCCTAMRGRAIRTLATSASRRLNTWREAASTTSLLADFIATRSTSTGWCRTSRRCRTTTPSC